MKHTLNTCLWIVISIFVACSKPEDETPPEPPTTEIIIPSTEDEAPVLNAKAGAITLSFTATADWTADIINTRADSWLTINPTSGSKGEAQITITTTANESPDERNATVILKCGKTNKSIIITQKQKDALTVTSDKYIISPKGGNINVEVKANVNFEVEIKDEWIKKVNTRALTTSNLNFTVESNKTGTKREGQIVIKSGELSETIRVYQESKTSIILTKDEFMLSDVGGIIDIEVKNTVDYGIKGVPDWITENDLRNFSTHTLHYAVAANESYDAREAKIIFYDKNNESIADTIIVYQAYKGAIIVARNEYLLEAEGNILDFTVQSNLDFNITIDVDWIKQLSTKGLVDYPLRFTVLSHKDKASREGTITITAKDGSKSQSIKIKQQGATDYEAAEQSALIALYNATGGDNWKNNENWCTEADISTWYGVEVQNGRVHYLNLYDNNLIGTLPKEIGNLSKLTVLQMANNKLNGELPKEFYTLSNLDAIYLQDNQIEGRLSEDIKLLYKLNTFIITNNQFEGELPVGLSSLTHLTTFQILSNRFSGEIPAEVMNMPNWENAISKWIEPQQPGYSFTTTVTKAMINLGDNFYLHPDGLAIEYRQGINKAITYEEMKPVLKKIYTKLKDDFDFVVCLYNVGNMEEIGGNLAGQFLPISFSIQGVGIDPINNSAEFGSNGNLDGLICLSGRTGIEGVLLHELAHNWGAPDLGQWSLNSDGTAERSPVHWGISSVDGLLGGFKLSTLQRNVDGNPNKYKASCSDTDWCFTTESASSYYYAPLELYLMGLIAPNEVPDIYIYDGISGSSNENVFKNGIFYATTERELTIQDIINKLGQRVPDYQNSQKNFRILTLVITKNAVDDREWSIIEDDILKMQKQGPSGYEHVTNFWEATGGRATLKMDEIDKSLK